MRGDEEEGDGHNDLTGSIQRNESKIDTVRNRVIMNVNEKIKY